MVNDFPSSLSQCICGVVRRAARHVTNAYDKELAPSGLRVTQFGVLTVLARCSTATVTQLAGYLSLDQTTATRNLIQLESAGYVERIAHHDPRVKLLRLTKKGKQKVQSAALLWQQAQMKIQRRVPASDLAELRRVLEKIESAALLMDADC